MRGFSSVRDDARRVSIRIAQPLLRGAPGAFTVPVASTTVLGYGPGTRGKRRIRTLQRLIRVLFIKSTQQRGKTQTQFNTSKRQFRFIRCTTERSRPDRPETVKAF